MATYVYVAAQDDNKVSIFTMDEASGALTIAGEESVSGGPSLLAISPDRQTLYAGHREVPEITSHSIDQQTGELTQTGSVIPPGQPAFLATDRTGRFLLSSYYADGKAAVHPLGDDGSVGGAATCVLDTDTGAHSIQTDRSNRYAYVPHIARVQDNVLEPPKNIPGPNIIYQFRFDESSGTLAANDPLTLAQDDMIGPRHLTYHPSLDIVYFSNEQGCSVSSYTIGEDGALTPLETVSTLPAGVTERNTCSQLQFSPDGSLLFVPNRGHNSIASFTVDGEGRLTPADHAATEAVPSAFSLDPSGRYVFAAGSATGQLASYSIDGNTGAMTPLGTYAVGERPMWVLTTTLG
ncbi:MAG: beta-propeller fold lactonase family protein [Chloroflexota bacterium]|nr:beta-propeller fold lactonase family protein [Chloroflexota bacterium]MDE2685529.1 beta-propeller fold lactonase family protein [Chloroflexota bacterium]